MDQNYERKIERFLVKIRSRGLAFAAFRLGDEDTALDTVQEAMMGFVKAVEGYEEEAWTNLFYKILTRRVTDWQRKESWRRKLAHISLFSHFGKGQDEEGESYEANIADTESPDPVHADLMSGVLASDYEAALAALPPRQQEAYLLRHWQGMSTREAAEIMRCSEGSVKTHLSRAMHSLKSELKHWMEEE